jgi:hypothetical protein
MNRDHVQGAGAHGTAGTHAQTLALYRLLDELGDAHPHVEIESCSSGGARIDHEILRRTCRVWTSDSNDALDRQSIQRGASMFVPPEVMGAHIGPTRSHTTGRVHTLAFRAATAMFGHLGIEWDVTRLDERDRTALAGAIALHQRFRPLLHGGDTVRFDVEEPFLAHGVYATDRSEALVCWVGFWAVTRHEDVRVVGKDHQRFSSEPTIMMQDPDPAGRVDLGDHKMMLMSDPPYHTALRRLISRDFTPRSAAAYRARVEELAGQIVDQVVERGECDLVADIAGEMPSYVAAELLGLPLADGRELYRLTEILHSDPASLPPGAGAAALGEMFGHAAELWAREGGRARRRPGQRLHGRPGRGPPRGPDRLRAVLPAAGRRGRRHHPQPGGRGAGRPVRLTPTSSTACAATSGCSPPPSRSCSGG